MGSFQITFSTTGKSLSAGSVIEANGKHSLDITSFVWAILRDIIEIIFVKVNQDGNNDFLGKVKNHDWGAFDSFPPRTETVGSVSVRM